MHSKFILCFSGYAQTHNLMDKFCNDKISNLETSISELEIEVDCSIQRIESIIQLIVEYLTEIKEHVWKLR